MLSRENDVARFQDCAPRTAWLVREVAYIPFVIVEFEPLNVDGKSPVSLRMGLGENCYRRTEKNCVNDPVRTHV